MAKAILCPRCGKAVLAHGVSGPDDTTWHPSCLRSASRAKSSEATISELEKTKADLQSKIERHREG